MEEIKVRKQSPEEELDYLYEIHGKDNTSELFRILINSSTVLHNRSQLTLSLATICLTIAGFSGPRIAATGAFTRGSLCFGLVFVLLSVFIVISGPLHLRWGTQRRAGTIHDSLVYMIAQRNIRTYKYHVAVALLIVGLTGFFGSVAGFVLGMK